MKKIFLIALIIGLFVSVAGAAPFLVCDPQENVDSYIVIIDGQNSETQYPLHYDLQELQRGNHTVEVKAKNIWGESESSKIIFWSGAPDAPTNLRIVVE